MQQSSPEYVMRLNKIKQVAKANHKNIFFFQLTSYKLKSKIDIG